VTDRGHNLTSREERARPGKPARLPGCASRLANIENVILTRFSSVPTHGAGPRARRVAAVPVGSGRPPASAPYSYHRADRGIAAAGPHGVTAARGPRPTRPVPSDRGAPSQAEG